MKVGIDLGTTYSSVAYFDQNTRKPVVIKNHYGHSGTPSVLCINSNETYYGEEAKELQEFGEDNIAAFYKRNMGEETFKLVFDGKSYSAEDLSAIFLKKLVEDAEKQVGQKITDAVITVPAYFDDYKRNATKRAGERAGLNILRTLNEPTAAAIAFGLDKLVGDNTYLVYDLGGGTFDVTLVNISSNGIRVLGTDGDHQLGGKDWDDKLAEYVAGLFLDEFGFNILEEQESLYELLLKCENAKKELSEREQTNISISASGEKGKYTIKIEEFNSITDSLMERTRQLCEELLRKCSLAWSDIDGVLLVGGSTRMSMVRTFVKEMSQKDPVYGVNVDEAVALGAAIQCEIDSHDSEINYFLGSKSSDMPTLGAANIVDVTAHALGRLQIKADRTSFFNDVMIKENTAIPCSVTKPTLINARSSRNGETDIYVLQGANESPLENTVLRKHVVSGIETNGRNEIIIDVTYHYDRDGIVKIEAVQKDNNKQLNVRCESLPNDLSWMDGSPDAMKGSAVPVTVVVCIDTSGSMCNCLSEAKKAAKNLVSSLEMSNANVAIVSFETNVRVVLNPTKDLIKINSAIDSLGNGGGTEEPMTTAYALLQNFATEKFIVVLTDGAWNNPEKAKSVAEDCKIDGIEVLAVGIGDSVNESFLREISSMDNMDVLTDISSMVSTFGNIGQEIVNRSSTGLRGFF